MIYFLREPGTERVSIRYYHKASSYEKRSAAEGLEILRIEIGGQDRLQYLDHLFRNCRGIGFLFWLRGDLKRYVSFKPSARGLLLKDVADMYALSVADVRVARKELGIEKLAPENTLTIYEHCRDVARKREKESREIARNARQPQELDGYRKMPVW